MKRMQDYFFKDTTTILELSGIPSAMAEYSELVSIVAF